MVLSGVVIVDVLHEAHAAVVNPTSASPMMILRIVLSLVITILFE